MSTNAAIASSSAAISAGAAAIAAEEARQAKIARCQIFMPNFDQKVATVEEKRAYAQCVDLMHPEPWSDGSIYVAKAFFALALVGMCYGFWRAYRDKYGCDFSEYALFGVIGFFVAPLAVGCVVGLMAGIVWLFR